MKISIITVCYNAENTIEETIKSVLKQTYNNIEYIVVDGLSSDNTTQIIQKYNDKISCFISEKDTGIFNAMNKGIKAATGDVLYFLNANDLLYDENIIETIINFFKNKKKASIVFGDIYYYTNPTSKDFTDFFTPDTLSIQSKFNSKYTLWDDCINHQSIFYKKDVFDKCGLYPEERPMSGDYEFNVISMVKNNIKPYYIPITIAKFELGGFSTLDSPENLNASLNSKKFIQEKYMAKRLDFRVYKFIKKIIRIFFKRNIIKYETNKKYKESVDKLFSKLFGWGFY